VDTKEQLEALLTLPDGTIDFILCDNFGPEALAEAVKLRDQVGREERLKARRESVLQGSGGG
jgi:nicotinate-nucleotide pyrophosphorylase